jgi:glycosyltransferase involved in cell wall biosynthesis
MVVLEAMSWGLPVITTKVATEFITESRDGFILKTPSRLEYYKDNYLVSETTERLKLVDSIKHYDRKDVVEEMQLLISSLIEHPNHIEQIGKAAKLEADSSIKIRNEALKEVFDRC